MQPPTLLSLTIDSALRHIAHIADLSAIPDPIVLELFWVTLKTLQAGKLTEKVLKLFMATGNADILSFVHRLNIKPTLTPVLPTSKNHAISFWFMPELYKMISISLS
ncbi:hypothetical protein BHE74_00059369 [Ensete ventricosum]|nr:hypothetical protein GW17_00031305 [Ensete ventricosum]RWW35671.1 hypothetical protein BHE74_00059369 [Ensete ventricosum]RZS28264.1 hypothetical protein BHM03_00061846 [Ensete ventricosum]